MIDHLDGADAEVGIQLEAAWDDAEGDDPGDEDPGRGPSGGQTAA